MQRKITRELVRRLLPGRMAESNKGSYGSVLAAAGSMAYRGAAALCTEGALRGGAGLVYLASVEPVIQLVLSRTPECCACGCRTAANGGIHPQDADALRRWLWEHGFSFAADRPVQAAGRWYAVMAAEYTGEVKTPTFQECLFGLTGQWPEGEGYAAWQKAKLPRLRLGVPDGTELAKEMDELIKGESKG